MEKGGGGGGSKITNDGVCVSEWKESVCKKIVGNGFLFAGFCLGGCGGCQWLSWFFFFWVGGGGGGGV